MATHTKKRCPPGSHRQKKGTCKIVRKRCPNGTRKHHKSGRCHKK